jgi:hypothetical protein
MDNKLYLDIQGSKGDFWSGKMELQNQDDGNSNRLFRTNIANSAYYKQPHIEHARKLLIRNGKYLVYDGSEVGGDTTDINEASDVMFLKWPDVL